MVDSVIPPVPGAACLPLAPGVYRFRDQAGRVLYVGRAISLRRRVLSYWGDLGDRGCFGGAESFLTISLGCVSEPLTYTYHPRHDRQTRRTRAASRADRRGRAGLH